MLVFFQYVKYFLAIFMYDHTFPCIFQPHVLNTCTSLYTNIHKILILFELIIRSKPFTNKAYFSPNHKYEKHFQTYGCYLWVISKHTHKCLLI